MKLIKAEMDTIREGFKGQQLIVVPDEIKRVCREDPVMSQLYITDIGYFPSASNHLVEREMSMPQNILIYCVGGEGWCNISDHFNIIMRNNFFIIPSGVTHSYGSVEGGEWEIYWVHFRGDSAVSLADRLCDGSFGVPVPYTKNRDTIELFKEIITIFESGITINSCGFASMKLWHFLGNLVYRRCISDGNNDGMVEKAIRFMAEKARGYLTLKDLSVYMGLSSSYLCRVFKSKTGHTPMDYFIRLKRFSLHVNILIFQI